jgi:hypothetical protein
VLADRWVQFGCSSLSQVLPMLSARDLPPGNTGIGIPFDTQLEFRVARQGGADELLHSSSDTFPASRARIR